MDEFHRNFLQRCEPEFKNKVLVVKKMIVPIFKRINLWKDLKEYRNNIIAHPWRDKKGSFVVPDINKYKIPRNWFEHIVLVDLISYTYDIIRTIFQIEFPSMFKFMESLIPPKKEKINYKKLTDDHVAMAYEVDAIALKAGVSYDMRIQGYTFDND